MDIQFACIQCGQQLIIDQSGSGLQVTCPHCQATVTVPMVTSTEPNDLPTIDFPPATPPDEPVRHHTGIRLKHPPPPPQPTPGPDELRFLTERPMAMPESIAEPGPDDEQFQCMNPACGARWFRSHLKPQEFGGRVVYLCPGCRLVLTPVRDAESFNFWGAVPGAFRFPFVGNGPWILGTGTIFFTFLAIGCRVPLFGLIIFFMMYGMLGMFLFDVVRTAAQEHNPELDWPDFGDIGGVVMEGLRFIGASLTVFGPAILCLFMAGISFWGPPTSLGNIGIHTGVWAVAAVLFFLGGIVYYPMAMLSVAMLDTIMGVNPVLVVRGIVRAPLQYACVWALLTMLLFARMGIAFGVSHIPSLVVSLAVFLPIRFVGFYGLIVSAHLLGLLYRARGQKFGWL
jgi:DNA-directed RNA polymerase subunit RPC12/RpoP